MSANPATMTHGCGDRLKWAEAQARAEPKAPSSSFPLKISLYFGEMLFIFQA
jgi:hypothetical protein